MTASTPEALLAALAWRYAVKKFDSTRTIAPAVWTALESAIHLSPASYGFHTTRALVIEDKELRARLREAARGQPQVTDASHLVVFAHRAQMSSREVDALMSRVSEVRGIPLEGLQERRSMLNHALATPANLKGGSDEAFARNQTYIALGVFLASAAMLGVDACPMEGFDAGAVDGLLGLPSEGWKTTLLAAAGYRSSEDRLANLAKVRFPREQVIVHR